MKSIDVAIVLACVTYVAPSGERLDAASQAAGTPPITRGSAAAAAFAWPAAVETAFKEKYPNATVKAVIKETAAGKIMYEVESVDGGRRRNIDYNPDGTIIRYEEELAPGEVPAAVRAALKVRYPAATVTLWERLYTTADNSANYECHLRGAAVGEAVLTPDGKWISPKGAR
jgi:hypothetical protein